MYLFIRSTLMAKNKVKLIAIAFYNDNQKTNYTRGNQVKNQRTEVEKTKSDNSKGSNRV